MKTNFLYSLLLISNFLYSQISFEPEQVLFDKGLYHHSMIIKSFPSDIDQDDDKDIISLSYAFSSEMVIAWFENYEGDFLYNHPNTIIEDAYISDLFVIDVNGDNMNDIIITSDYSNDKLYWVENLGDGSFSNENIINNTINNPRVLYAIDIDNDGDSDILVDNNNDEILFFENIGNGIFNSEQVIYSGNYSVKKIITEDINNDGLLDIVSGHSDGTIYWAENYGNNTFSDKRYITGAADDGTSIGFLDVNNDGYMDLITSSNYDDDVKYCINLNGVSFDNPIIIDDTNEYPYELKIIDMDNDGLEDIVISFWTNDKIGWYKNLDNGNWSPLTVLIDNINNPKVFLVEDFDNDSFYDIVSTSRKVSDEGENKLSHYLFDTNSGLYSEYKLIFPHGPPQIVRIADLDNDINNDIISATSYYLLWNKNKGGGEFTNRKIISDNDYNDFEAVDINSDGLIDIIAVGENTDVFINEGNGIFNMEVTIPISAEFVEINNINNDNYLDIIISHYNDVDKRNDFYIIKNQGENNFETPSLIYSTTGQNFYDPSNFKCGDIDLDGDIDIIFNTIDNYDIHKLLNDGYGNFNYFLINSTSGASESLELEDLNNDGYLDIITGYGSIYSNYSLFWFKNLSGSAFTEPIIIDSNLSIESIDFTDLNYDGYKDIIVTNLTSSSENIYYIINNNTNFEYRVLLAALTSQYGYSRDLDLGFLDNDNKIDIVTSYFLRYKVGLYLNSSTIGVDETLNSFNEDVIIYPNPFTNKLVFNMNNQQFFISIFNLDGNKVYENSKKINELDLHFLKEGFYVIHLWNKDFSIYKKIIKK